MVVAVGVGLVVMPVVGVEGGGVVKALDGRE